ncbi:hypothetical protein PoB_005717100 [Plakobranchus ocellatus]|uniref:Uncharacterized protein n=1 Tax=Plakobranchus ocellatus TaxID=259542 RepID=A0AAV4CD48_9GAST|nr:hypothetical protein PoB_005717100 [Plakobranchus ocellatus]
MKQDFGRQAGPMPRRTGLIELIECTGPGAVMLGGSWSCHIYWGSAINQYIDPYIKHSLQEICFPRPCINRLTPLKDARALWIFLPTASFYVHKNTQKLYWIKTRANKCLCSLENLFILLPGIQSPSIRRGGVGPVVLLCG